MSDAMMRIAQIRSRFVAPVAAAPARSSSAAGASTAFSSVLASARAAGAATAAEPAAGGDLSGRAGLGAASTLASLSSLSTLVAGGTATLGTATLGAASPATANSTAATPRVPEAYQGYRELIGQVATEEGVPASLLGALVWSESGFDPAAVSPAGARGLAQLMPGTAEGLGVDIDDPADNLRGGARYLRSMLDRFGRVDLALAAYNAGPNAVARAGGIPAYQETQTYVTRVLTRAAALSGGNPS